MSRTLPFLILTLLPLTGCKGGHEKDLVGSWVSKQGMKVVVAPDKTYEIDGARIKTTGTWATDGEDFVFQPTTINGKAIAEVKTRLQSYASRAPTSRRPLLDKLVHDIGLPNILTLSKDGKSLTTDKAKDKNEDGWTTLTKQSGA